ncbi:MAG TPA: FtsX-like permease family protein, partial [Gemmataceae bacterium]|nr:FtsX-like permease family protein [Gemmataceae bacterium]
FTLRPRPSPPLNIFVPLRLIQEQTNAEEKTPLLGRVNALLAADVQGSLADALQQHLTLEDWSLELTTPEQRGKDLFKLLADTDFNQKQWKDTLRRFRWKTPVLRVPDGLAKQANDKDELTVSQFVDFYNREHGYLNLSSTQVFIDDFTVKAAEKAAAQLKWRSAPTLAYMVDTLSYGTNNVAYVIVAALDPAMPSPLGPFQPPGMPPLKDDQILLAQWPGSPLKLEPGQKLTLRYDVPDAAGKLQRRQETMTFGGWVPLHGAADDPDLTPRFEGITDRLSILKWSTNLPFEVKLNRLKKPDHDFWDRYRATPRAYVNLPTGQRLWGSRFGQVTSIRLAAAKPSGTSADFALDDREFRAALLKQMDPKDGGLAFEDVRSQALGTQQGGFDFGILFLGFSSFLIAAALLLVGLMFRLNIDRRAAELGLLLAVGWRRTTVRWLVLAEGAKVAALGALVGVGVAVWFASLLLDYLSSSWPGGLERSFLRLHVTWQSCAFGFVTSLAVSVLTIRWATRILAKVPPRALLAGETVATTPMLSRKRLGMVVMLVGIVGAIGCGVTGALAQDHEAQAGSFLGSGIFVLTALLAGLRGWMHRAGHAVQTMPRLGRLGVRNATRHPVRSLLTVGLLAAASFMVVAVQAFHRDPGHDFLEQTGGSGGFAWIGETTVPVFNVDARLMPFRVQDGDDASCLNLYQPRQPRILGVPPKLIDRGGFQFADSEAKEGQNPWQLLQEKRGDGAIPAIGEVNTVTWMLKSGLGQHVTIRDGNGKETRLRIVALLKDSVFQGELLISDSNFLQLYPRQEGFRFFLIDAPAGDKGETVRRALEKELADYGFSMTPSEQRLQSYLDVENTYLATFQALGGLGLLLGTLGLAAVLVRSVWERRGELALLRALGFRRSALGWLVLAENAWLLMLGLTFGCAAAFVAVAPFVVSQAGTVLQLKILLLLGLVVVVGLAAGGMAVTMTLRTPLLAALRRE